MKWKIIAAIAVAGLAYDEIVIIRNNKKFNRLKEGFSELANTNDYLAHKLDQHHVPMDEFDRIVMKTSL